MHTSIIKLTTTTTTTISMMTTTKCITTSHGLSFHKPGALTKFGSHSKNVVCVGNQRKKGLGVKCAGGWSNVSAGNVKKVNGGDTLQTVERSVDGSHDEAMKGFKLGTFVEDRLVYRQIFVIRSYEIGPDKTATMETLMNLLQETALNHVRSSGLASDGFGATHEMSLRKLIWVVTRIDIQVDRYSHWGDVIEIDTWVAASGKNGMRRDWVIRDPRTQNIITRATSTWVMMNRETRRLTKIPEQVRKELKPFFLDRRILLQTGVDKRIDKLNEETAEYLKSGLAPRWSDMDVNQHVNNVKYFGWILESVPLNVLEYYHLTSITLEYRRECRQSNILQSLTTMKKWGVEEKLGRAHKGDLGSTHLLRLEEDKAEIVRARAEWQAKRHI